MVVLVQSTKLAYMRPKAFLYTTHLMAAIRPTMRYPGSVHEERERSPCGTKMRQHLRERGREQDYIRKGKKEGKGKRCKEISHNSCQAGHNNQSHCHVACIFESAYNR